jgi:hypothetical protein
MGNSSETSARSESQDLVSVEEELCARAGRPVPRLAHSALDPEQDGG